MNRNEQKETLSRLSQGYGGRVLVEQHGTILEQIDEDLLLDWVRKMPTSKVGHLYQADVSPGPKLDKVATDVLSETASKAMESNAAASRIREQMSLQRGEFVSVSAKDLEILLGNE